MEGVDDGCSEVAEAFCRAEACKGRAVDGGRVAGGFRGSVVCSSDGGGLLEKASAEVMWKVCGDVFLRDLCGPRGLSAGKEEHAVGGWGVSCEVQAEFRRVGAELRWV